jgi:hypothetical protein
MWKRKLAHAVGDAAAGSGTRAVIDAARKADAHAVGDPAEGSSAHAVRIQRGTPGVPI